MIFVFFQGISWFVVVYETEPHHVNERIHMQKQKISIYGRLHLQQNNQPNKPTNK